VADRLFVHCRTDLFASRMVVPFFSLFPSAHFLFPLPYSCTRVFSSPQGLLTPFLPCLVFFSHFPFFFAIDTLFACFLPPLSLPYFSTFVYLSLFFFMFAFFHFLSPSPFFFFFSLSLFFSSLSVFSTFTLHTLVRIDGKVHPF